MLHMHITFSIFIFRVKISILHLQRGLIDTLKLYSKIFHIEWFTEEKLFLWILPMSDDTDN